MSSFDPGAPLPPLPPRPDEPPLWRIERFVTRVDRFETRSERARRRSGAEGVRERAWGKDQAVDRRQAYAVALAGFVASLWSRYGYRVNLALFFQVTAVFLMIFVVQLSYAPASAVTYDIVTSGGTADAGGDYEPNSQSGGRIEAGQDSATFTVTVYGDTMDESDETFSVDVTNVAGGGATIGDGRARGTIRDDDYNFY